MLAPFVCRESPLLSCRAPSLLSFGGAVLPCSGDCSFRCRGGSPSAVIWRRFHWRWCAWPCHRHGRRAFAAVRARRSVTAAFAQVPLPSSSVVKSSPLLSCIWRVNAAFVCVRRESPLPSGMCRAVPSSVARGAPRPPPSVVGHAALVRARSVVSHRCHQACAEQCRAASLEARRGRRRLSSVMLPSCSWLSVVS